MGYRVLGVQANSPASAIGLVSFFDFAPQRRLPQRSFSGGWVEIPPPLVVERDSYGFRAGHKAFDLSPDVRVRARATVRGPCEWRSRSTREALG